MDIFGQHNWIYDNDIFKDSLKKSIFTKDGNRIFIITSFQGSSPIDQSVFYKEKEIFFKELYRDIKLFNGEAEIYNHSTALFKIMEQKEYNSYIQKKKFLEKC